MKSLLALLLVAACGGGQQDVAVNGTDLDLARIQGDWDGTYTGTDSGRSGPVKFSLQLGRHSADGEVVMNGATPLKIEFVNIKKDQVKGTIAPYTDPTCSCEVQTTFTGTLADNAITGTFETKVSKTGQVQAGTWSVTRHQ
ncbi:MAG TPA: hypothetical protein VLT45_14220 [Kofleriaceae bacterium]|nr:hypothetical protein [Kofleriaceae bacterium]